MNRTPEPNAGVDDIDRLFARLDRAPVPEALTSRVLASTVARSGSFWPWMIAGLVALGLLSLAGYQIGATLAAGDGLDLLAALLDDLGVFTTAPGDVMAALGEVIPWSLVAVGGVGAGLLVLTAGHVVSRPASAQRTRQIA